MEAIIVIVGFLGSGKTTLLKKIVQEYLDQGKSPSVLLNDYQNANMDAQFFLKLLKRDQVNALSGSCICCSGVTELRQYINSVPERENGVTLVEANGTTDACSLMGFLGVGMKDHFLPPIQIAVVDVRNWQKRGYHNELESSQVQVASMIVLNYVDQVSASALEEIKVDIRKYNQTAIMKDWGDLDISELPKLHPSSNEFNEIDHKKSHWSSCSADLPDPISSDHLSRVLDAIPADILRIKGCTKLDKNSHYSLFERIPSGEISIKPYTGTLVTGPKILLIGPGSDPYALNKIIEEGYNK